ncbi:hypothetical protein TNCV_3882701 [Trichonephila clavipes]|nr:hypothetical protein TNCV_3882701 [Trichonephila clavipes]
MDDNARPLRANIVDECLQSEDIIRMDWPAYSPDLNPIEHVWNMLGRRIAARNLPPPSPDAIGIAESGSSADNLRFFPLKVYKSYSLGRSRQIASGIVIFIKNDLTSEPLLKHAMTSSDSLEEIELRVWKRNIGYRVSFLFSPPRNKSDLNSLIHDWNKHSFILGDFNAHSTRWGYVQNCPVGNLVEDFIDTNEIDFIENSTASPTFLSYRGASSRPDLLLAHPNLTPFVYHHLIQATGGAGHKILSVIISNPGETHAFRVTRWNLKKADWGKYASLLNTLLGNCLLDLNNDKALDKIITTILACANVCIPKGHIINGKPFWNVKLQTVKKKKDLERDRAGLLKIAYR